MKPTCGIFWTNLATAYGWCQRSHALAVQGWLESTLREAFKHAWKTQVQQQGTKETLVTKDRRVCSVRTLLLPHVLQQQEMEKKCNIQRCGLARRRQGLSSALIHQGHKTQSGSLLQHLRRHRVSAQPNIKVLQLQHFDRRWGVLIVRGCKRFEDRSKPYPCGNLPNSSNSRGKLAQARPALTAAAASATSEEENCGSSDEGSSRDHK
eukprot:1144715-Pelagomonas_calceolata.AAC.1